MSKRWVDGEDYFGPDRRGRRHQRRLLGERRASDETRERLSVAAMLRRVRVQLVTVRTELERGKTLHYIKTAWIACEADGQTKRADLLKQAARNLTAAPLNDKRALSQIDDLIAAAMAADA
jgi:hypothetical protein